MSLSVRVPLAAFVSCFHRVLLGVELKDSTLNAVIDAHCHFCISLALSLSLSACLPCFSPPGHIYILKSFSGTIVKLISNDSDDSSGETKSHAVSQALIHKVIQ